MLADKSIDVGVIQIYLWKDRPEKCFGSLNPSFQGLDILGSRVSSSIGRLVICAICRAYVKWLWWKDW
jgi:hypothetical protein